MREVSRSRQLVSQGFLIAVGLFVFVIRFAQKGERRAITAGRRLDHVRHVAELRLFGRLQLLLLLFALCRLLLRAVLVVLKRCEPRLKQVVPPFLVEVVEFLPTAVLLDRRAVRIQVERAAVGNAFEFLRDHRMNAKNYYAAIGPNGKKRDDGLHRDQFGGTIGGPLIASKLFYFAGYQGTEIRSTGGAVPGLGTSSFFSIPTPAMINGDFSGLLPKTIRDPNSNAPFPGNIIPAARYNPVSKYIIDNTIPIPTSGNRVFTSAPNNVDDTQVLARGDHAL